MAEPEQSGPGEMHFICPACRHWTFHATADAAAHEIACDRCGARTPFTPLPPLLYLTGPSGAGKTTVYEALVGTMAEVVLFDADVVWGVADFNEPDTQYQRFYQLVLHLAARVARNGRPVVVEGTTIPDNIRRCGEHALFSEIGYLALVCDDAELEARLRARPAWRDSIRNLDAMLHLNQWYKDHAAEDPDLDLLDTTGVDPADTAEAVRHWIMARAVRSSA
jgi:predicted kinase